MSSVNINDVLLISSSVLSSLVMVVGGLIGRRRRLRRAPSVKELLGVKLRGLAEGYPQKLQSVFETELPYAPEGFEGRYTCAKLGCGGWGCAYKCEQNGHAVVFKVPRGLEAIVEEGEVPTVPERLLRRVIERAEVLARLEHPHVLRLLGYSSKLPLLVYEYADGGSVDWQLAMGWSPTPRDVLLLGIQLGDALRYIHSRGLVHGDVKSSNVFFVGGVAKLGDFSSLVKLLTQTSSHSRYAYTPGWRAPEQVFSDLRAKSVRRGLENRIDVYQLGNLILYLLTGDTVDGEDVYEEDRVKQALSKVGNRELEQLLRDMLRADPEHRPSMDEVLKRLVALYTRM